MHDDFPFLSEKKKVLKCNKRVCSIYDKKSYVAHIRALKQVLNHGLIIKQVHRVIQFNQEAWLKPYVGLNTKSRIEAKNDFEKDFSKLMNNAIFGKTMENVRKHRDNKLITTDKRRNQLVSEHNYHTKKCCLEDLSATKMKKTKVLINKPIYLGVSILEISKRLMYEIWQDHIKPKYQNNAKICYMDPDSFIIHIKTKDFSKDIAHDPEKWYDASNYSEDDKRLLPRGINKKVIGFFKDELGRKIIIEFVALRP